MEVESSKMKVVRKSADGKKEFRRCPYSVNLKSRLQTLKKHGGDMLGWEKLEGEDKIQWVRRAHHAQGEDLKKLLTETSKAHKRKQHLMKFGGKSQYMDKEDLEKKLANKPEQLQSVLDNPDNKFFCPVRKTEMIGLPEYFLETKNIYEQGEEKELHMSSEQTMKRAKVAKQARAQDALSSAPSVLPSKTLTGPQIEKISQLKQKLSESTLTLQAMRDEAQSEQYQDDVPKNVLKQAGLQLEALGKLAKSADDAVSSKRISEKIGTFLVSVKAACKQADAMKDKLQSFVDSATVESEEGNALGNA